MISSTSRFAAGGPPGHRRLSKTAPAQSDARLSERQPSAAAPPDRSAGTAAPHAGYTDLGISAQDMRHIQATARAIPRVDHADRHPTAAPTGWLGRAWRFATGTLGAVSGVTALTTFVRHQR